MSDVQISDLVGRMRMMEAMAKNTEIAPKLAPGTDFGSVFQEQIEKVNDLQGRSKELKTSYELGDPTVNLVDVMLASQKAGISFQAMMQVRNKLISAYQEIMSMSV